MTRALLTMALNALQRPRPQQNFYQRSCDDADVAKAIRAHLAQPERWPLPKAIEDVATERTRQDAKWGGPIHDDHHTVAEFCQLIEDYAGWARTMAGMNSFDKARTRLIQVAALAVAAVEMLDRNDTKVAP